ncbi:MAG: alpha/beta hydrolase [bacterium]|nr:alpha/beta hydrolase [bacterium]
MPVRNLLQPLRGLTDNTTVETNLRYKPTSISERHELDLILPTNIERPRGLVLFIHGGFWTNQDRRYFRPVTGLYWNIGYGLANAGYAAAILSYRIYPEADIQGQLDDIQAALDWGGEKIGSLNIDADRLFLMGHSAGGHLAALSALDSKKPAIDRGLAGVVALSPVLDVAHMRDSQPADFNRQVTEAVFGKDASDQELARRSPGLRWPKDAPLLVLTGEQDYPFIRTQAAELLKRHPPGSSQVQVRELPGLTHADLVLQFDADPSPVLPAVLEFLNQPAGPAAK